ncbi:MAG: hypothetical protein P4L20_13965 [Acidimicrobiales bacterium]|nr:hypothetical protein [Acidimicrobiales bacterium]
MGSGADATEVGPVDAAVSTQTPTTTTPPATSPTDAAAPSAAAEPGEVGCNGSAVAPAAPGMMSTGTMATGTMAAVLEAAPDPAPVSVSPPVVTTIASTASSVVSVPHVPAHLAAKHDAETGGRRRRWPWVASTLLVMAAVVLGFQLSRAFPTVSVKRTVPVSVAVAGTTPVLPWPATGEAAIAVPQLGVAVASGAEAPVPIASLTKIMTAYLTLRDHPLAPGAQGPALAMTAADQAAAEVEGEAGDTNVPVQPGEVLSERQLLNGLLVHSADNFADILARWDAGTVPAFVADMNATAASLGMAHTHYADASGLDPGTTGTAADQLRVAGAAMAVPTFADVVDQHSVTLPVAGVLDNYVQSVGTDGIVGVKSGFTQAAMGCLVLAAQRTVAGHSVLVLAAVTGQPGGNPLATANRADIRLLDAVAAALRPVPLTPGGVQVASVTLPWSPKRVPVVASRAVSLLGWPGQVPRLSMTLDPLHPGLRAGSRVGTLSVSLGPQRALVPVRVADSLVGPSVPWRLARS